MELEHVLPCYSSYQIMSADRSKLCEFLLEESNKAGSPEMKGLHGFMWQIAVERQTVRSTEESFFSSGLLIVTHVGFIEEIAQLRVIRVCCSLSMLGWLVPS